MPGDSKVTGQRRPKAKTSGPVNASKARIPQPQSNTRTAEKEDPPPDEVEVLHSEEEVVYIAQDVDENVDNTDERGEEDREIMNAIDEEEEEPPKQQPPRRDYRKCNLTPENFNVKAFNTNMTELVATLEDPRYSQVDVGYPVDELVTVVEMVSKNVNHYRIHSSDSQYQLEALTEAMSKIRENLHFSVSRQAMDMRGDHESQTQEERDLRARLTQLTNSLAQANADVSEAVRLATETEATAVKANIAAERAREEANRIKEEARRKEEAEERKITQEKKRMEEAKRLKEEEERKALEEKQRKEEEWKKREALANDKHAHPYDNWTPVEFEHKNENGETEIACIARGEPGHFERRDVICQVATGNEGSVTYLPNEELISHVIEMKSKDDNAELKRPVYVAIPHVMTRSSANTREAVVKALCDGEWQDLPTRDVTFESHKDTRFAQAEVTHLTTLVVMSRFKRDYHTLTPGRPHTINSTVDHRVSLTMEPDTFNSNEHFLLQVQPVDSATTNEFRTREAKGKSLLNSSPIVHTTWETTYFNCPIEVTVNCAPNPAKARKMALARKLKEEKMKNPHKPMMMDGEEKKKVEPRRTQTGSEDGTEVKNRTKWYMGEYGNSDDDESDRLYFLYAQGGKWSVEPDMEIRQVKVDVLGFSLDQPVERFVILRTRTNVDEDGVLQLVGLLNEYMSKRFVEAVVRQKADDPFEVALQVTPTGRVESVVSQFKEQGFESGPSPSHVICLHEGDIIELGFSGNIECKDDLPEFLVFKSNVPTVTFFRVKEENKFRQKDHDVYSGLLCLTRRFLEVHKSRRQQAEGDDQPEVKRERLCALQINIPKYHVAPNTEPVKAPVTIRQSLGAVETDVLEKVADSLGDEWKRLAHYLGVHRARVQAILRNINVGDRPEKDAKYEMLMTWLKGAAKSLDKVSALSAALRHCERFDLADTVQKKGRRDSRLSSQELQTLTPVN